MTKQKATDIINWLSDEENKEALKLIINRAKYLLRHMRLRKLKGDITFGFDDPYTVGRILGLLSLLYPLYGDKIRITPVFDRDIIEGDFDFKGHIRLIHVLIAGIQLLLNKKIRELIFSEPKGEDDGRHKQRKRTD